MRGALIERRRWAWLLALVAALSLSTVPAAADDGGLVVARPARTPTPAPTATPRPAPSPEPPPDAAGAPYPIPDDQPADYPLQSGHFFSQAVPGAQPGFGFTVTDAAGIRLWSEYQRHGGLQDLGYPISRRFAWGGAIAQAFQGGALRWWAELGQADIVPQPDGWLPPEAAVPEPPARLGSSVTRQPWSGWWWPATTAVAGPHLFDTHGPLAKYDRYVVETGGVAPGVLEWERSELQLAGVPWAGHCNGWAAAALLEDEPTEPITAGGVAFTVADLKGLLSAYHYADAAAWLHGGDDLMPIDFHTTLVEWLGNGKQGFIVTFRPSADEEVWSYPAYRFELTMSPDPLDPDVTHVQALVWLADNNVPANFVGLRPWKGDAQVYEYRLYGPRDAPTGGEWEGASASGRFAHPYFIWYPDPNHRNIDRALASDSLDYSTIRAIRQGEVAQPAQGVADADSDRESDQPGEAEPEQHDNGDTDPDSNQEAEGGTDGDPEQHDNSD